MLPPSQDSQELTTGWDCGIGKRAGETSFLDVRVDGWTRGKKVAGIGVGEAWET